ncbi:YIP1 family protein [Methanosphaerula subterraneus]|uniref:YIP1 family protein n=1 Tax=Methanosphaerula subterraneus TaxID=3350244 RepID=UPI003F83369B
MSIPIIDTIRGMIVAPVQTMHQQEESTVQDTLIYYLEIILAFALLSTIVTALLQSAGFATTVDLLAPASLLIYLVGLIVGMIIALVIMVLIFHLCARVVGGDGEWTDTLRAVVFSSTPIAVIGWIPIVGSLIADLWSLVLMVVGIREYHHLSTGRAAIAVLLPVIVLIILAALAVSYLTISSATFTTVPT